MKEFNSLIVIFLSFLCFTLARADETYTKVTSQSQIEDGGTYIIVCDNATDCFAMGDYNQNGSNWNSLPVIISNNTITISSVSTSKPTEITLESSSSAYSLKCMDGYLYKKKTNGNDLSWAAKKTENYLWTITIGEETTVIKNKGKTNYSIFYNANNERFSCYTGSQSPISLYAKQMSSKINPSLSFPDTRYTTKVGSTFSTPELNNPYNVEVSYESSNPEVAEVNAITGNITVLSEGETVIKAVSVETAEYSYGEATYTLSVHPNNGKILFYESFNKAMNQGGNDGEWSGTLGGNSIETETNVTDNEGWTAKDKLAFPGKQCVYVGNSFYPGSLSSPNIVFEPNTTYRLTFKAAGWDAQNDGTTLNLASKSTKITMSPVSFTLAKGQWTEYTAMISSQGATTQITFANPDGRFFLDEVRIEAVSEQIPVKSSTGYATYVTKNNVAFTDAVKAYIVTAANNVQITLQQVDDVPAGTPIIVYAEQGIGTYDLNLLSVSSTDVASNLLRTSYGNIVGNGSTIYAMANLDGVGFYVVKEGVRIPTGYCYLLIGAEGLVKNFVPFVFSQKDANFIQSKGSVQGAADDDSFYTLQGVRVARPTDGIYIHRGKKFLVK